MLKISVEIKNVEDLARIHDITPDRFMRMWAIAVKNLAKGNAQEAARASKGHSFWQREILPSVHEDVEGDQATVYSDSYIAEHVHTGGPIRPRNRRYLAIPLPWNKKRNKHPSDYASNALFAKVSKAGNLLLFKRPAKGKELEKPLFALKEEVLQKPRPWWPDQAAVDAETERFFRKNF